MFCPRCGAEYRPGFTHCADCDVNLVWELPKHAIEMRQTGDDGEYRVAGGPGDPNEDPFCSFWKGDDPRVHAELCGVLEEAGIPHNTVYRRDHLFNLRNYSAFEVGVPFFDVRTCGKRGEGSLRHRGCYGCGCAGSATAAGSADTLDS